MKLKNSFICFQLWLFYLLFIHVEIISVEFFFSKKDFDYCVVLTCAYRIIQMMEITIKVVHNGCGVVIERICTSSFNASRIILFRFLTHSSSNKLNYSRNYTKQVTFTGDNTTEITNNVVDIDMRIETNLRVFQIGIVKITKIEIIMSKFCVSFGLEKREIIN